MLSVEEVLSHQERIKFTELKGPTQGHTVSQWQSWEWTEGQSAVLFRKLHSYAEHIYVFIFHWIKEPSSSLETKVSLRFPTGTFQVSPFPGHHNALTRLFHSQEKWTSMSAVSYCRFLGWLKEESLEQQTAQRNKLAATFSLAYASP